MDSNSVGKHSATTGLLVEDQQDQQVQSQDALRKGSSFAGSSMSSTTNKALPEIWKKNIPLCISNSVAVAPVPSMRVAKMQNELKLRRGRVDLDGGASGVLSWMIVRNPHIAFPLTLPMTFIETVSVAQIANQSKRMIWELVAAVRALTAHLVPTDVASRVIVTRRTRPLGKRQVISDVIVFFPFLLMDLETCTVMCRHLPSAFAHSLNEYFASARIDAWRLPLVGSRVPTCCPACFGLQRDSMCLLCDGYGVHYNTSVYVPFLSLDGPHMKDLGSFRDEDVEAAFAVTFQYQLIGPSTPSRACGMASNMRVVTLADLKLVARPTPIIARRQEPKVRQLITNQQNGFYGNGSRLQGIVKLTRGLCEFLVGCIRQLYTNWVWLQGATISSVQILAQDVTVVRLASMYSFVCPRREGCTASVHSVPSVCFALHACGKVHMLCMDPKCPLTHSKASTKVMNHLQLATLSDLLQGQGHGWRH